MDEWCRIVLSQGLSSFDLSFRLNKNQHYIYSVLKSNGSRYAHSGNGRYAHLLQRGDRFESGVRPQDLDSGTSIKNDIELVYEDDIYKYLEYL
jgi:hypothetical protein